MSKPVFGSRHVRALQRWAMGKARRSRFFPVTIPDRLGDDDRLAGVTLPHSVMVFFPDTQESLYQIRPWLRAFEALDAEERTVVVCQDSRTAQRLREESTLDVITVARYGRMDDLLSRGNLRLALYVNHSPRNFENLRFTSLTHVYLGHGDSDKGVSASNQVKAYDFCFVAGQAAVDRLALHVPRYDAEARCVVIGQPQLDSSGLLTLPPRPESGRTTVLYAPTWEGAQPSVAYSSVVSHGRALVRALLDDGSFDVIYRPHPLTGVTSGEYAAADAEIRAMVTDAPGAHRVDTGPDLHEAFAAADLLVCDVSGVALSWLPTGRPLVVTETDAAPATAGDSLTRGAERLTASEAAGLPGRVRSLLADAGYDDRMRALRDHYFLTTEHGGATRNFVAECRVLVSVAADGRTDVAGGANE
ncbi:CDP-glycerol:poly(glycerophosphate) glycerophosphotransferase [Flavimobilis soli]|uniref:CDP-glycerol:poly(Glycerophosphate) glycerophosphotransferase n=1 Tax=Flavimobilis soli TaxID=442709 RepID=A0A2A9EFB0_9MICO|nr:CDP-glycerol glycerophosphotransferase family protein [Flavimobilis soli]PFG37608.1 CDP-glycerol:poly(glycerophosphate) glycerophosphotransferase [Flavimobilis soli]